MRQYIIYTRESGQTRQHTVTADNGIKARWDFEDAHPGVQVIGTRRI